MVKNVLIGIFATLIVGAAGVSAYNVATEPTPVSAKTTEDTFSPASQRDDAAVAQAEPVPADGTGNEQNVRNLAGDSAAPIYQTPNGTEEHGNRGGQGGGSAEHGNGGGHNGGMEFITLHGIVTASDTSFVSILTDDGNALTFPMDSATVGFRLQPGEGVLLTGMWRGEGFFKAKEITVDSTGATYFLRGQRGEGGGGGGKGGR